MIFANFISHNSRSSIHVIPNQNGRAPSCKFVFLPSATKFAKVMFLHVSVILSMGEVSRPRPRGEVWGVWPGGVSRPRPRGGGWGVWPGGCPGPGRGVVSRPRSGVGGLSRPRPGGVCIPACTEADPPSRRLLLLTVRILLECILVNTHSFANKYYSIFFCTVSVCYFPRDFISVWSQLYTGTSNQLIWDQNM